MSLMGGEPEQVSCPASYAAAGTSNRNCITGPGPGSPDPALSDDAVARPVFPDQFHAPLGDERAQELVERLRDLRRRVDLERALFLDQPDAALLHVAGHDAGERTPQVCRALVNRLLHRELEAGHCGVAYLERLLERRRNPQQPVVVVRVAGPSARAADGVETALHRARDLGRVVDDDPVALPRLFPQRVADEVVELPEVPLALARAGEHERQWLVRVNRIEQDPDQIENLLRRARAPRKHDYSMAQPHERLEALLDVRHDHQLVDDRVRRLGREDAGLGDADVAAVLDALLGVADRRALHRALHRARSAAGAYRELAQSQLVADLLGVVVLLAR